MSKLEKLNNLYNEYTKAFGDREIVLGDGNVDSDILLIGEAPGKDEVIKKKPFVGVAGKNLSEFLHILNIDRRNIYITNVIKYRLSKVNPKTGRVSNRPPANKDIEENREYLLKEISIINPKIIVSLGNVPLRAVLSDMNVKIGDFHGNIKEVIIGESKYNLFPLYHPASIIYNRKLKDIYYKDLEKLKNILQ
ncbi:uracil-DNA glycosylase [Acetivibrio saccincola]|uniref:Type-4 uracil-DNA glycosylase n=1 Tax=Acetivibrio saccincola TaxID=1677857 RepID=A0A2S8REC4_9FIRM|nr:uracil-DNA glycosylase [Acetivibrio saccincola]PQQ68154.1 uracil-DNA glycosylase [Acetivibrio saccincola]